MDFNSVALSAEEGWPGFRSRRSYGLYGQARHADDRAPAIFSHRFGFLLLQLAEIPNSPAAEFKSEGRDFLLEIAPGELVDREVWERGYIEIDENGREVPIPASARLGCVDGIPAMRF